MLSRLRQRHAVRAAELLDTCGFSALEVFGGATFEAQPASWARIPSNGSAPWRPPLLGPR